MAIECEPYLDYFLSVVVSFVVTFNSSVIDDLQSINKYMKYIPSIYPSALPGD